MATTITCSRCGATMTGSVAEAMAWNGSHDEFCPGQQPIPSSTADQCAMTLTWTPFDGERGLYLNTRTEHCQLEVGHTGYHRGEGGVFGPWIPPEGSEEDR